MRFRHYAGFTEASVAVVLALSATAPAIAQSKTDTPHPKIELQFRSPRTSAMGPCPVDMKVVLTIRAIIPEHFNLASPANSPRNVFYKKPSANEAAEDGNPDPGKPVPGTMRNDPNPYHMDFRTITPRGKVDGHPYAEIRLILKDEAEYNRWYDRDQINGVGFGGDANTLKMCGAEFDSTKPPPPHPVAYFFVPLNPPVRGVPAGTGTFNFGLFPKTATDTPIFIDPKVINNG